jgi:hypothetical protein
LAANPGGRNYAFWLHTLHTLKCETLIRLEGLLSCWLPCPLSKTTTDLLLWHTCKDNASPHVAHLSQMMLEVPCSLVESFNPGNQYVSAALQTRLLQASYVRPIHFKGNQYFSTVHVKCPASYRLDRRTTGRDIFT